MFANFKRNIKLDNPHFLPYNWDSQLRKLSAAKAQRHFSVRRKYGEFISQLNQAKGVLCTCEKLLRWSGSTELRKIK